MKITSSFIARVRSLTWDGSKAVRLVSRELREGSEALIAAGCVVAIAAAVTYAWLGG